MMEEIQRSMVRAVCGVQLDDRKRAQDLTPMMSLNETTDRLAMGNSVRWYGCVEERGRSFLEKGIKSMRLMVTERKARSKRTRVEKRKS